MATKQKRGANGTYAFDPNAIDELDLVSLTSVLAAVVDANRREPATTESPDSIAPETEDATINKLLSGPINPADDRPAQGGVAEIADDGVARVKRSFGDVVAKN